MYQCTNNDWNPFSCSAEDSSSGESHLAGLTYDLEWAVCAEGGPVRAVRKLLAIILPLLLTSVVRDRVAE
jgi:hypothetical protein